MLDAITRSYCVGIQNIEKKNIGISNSRNQTSEHQTLEKYWTIKCMGENIGISKSGRKKIISI